MALISFFGVAYNEASPPGGAAGMVGVKDGPGSSFVPVIPAFTKGMKRTQDPFELVPPVEVSNSSSWPIG